MIAPSATPLSAYDRSGECKGQEGAFYAERAFAQAFFLCFRITRAVHEGDHEMNTRLACSLISVAALLGVAVSPDLHAQSPPQFSIGWYVISSGGTPMRKDCFVLNGTIGQSTPGYSSAGIFSLLSGYWSIAPITGTDEIFFNGFEGCSS
ncbi:MAG: hypothetical protein ABI082_02535 [Dokdonella sp.]